MRLALWRMDSALAPVAGAGSGAGAIRIPAARPAARRRSRRSSRSGSTSRSTPRATRARPRSRPSWPRCAPCLRRRLLPPRSRLRLAAGAERKPESAPAQKKLEKKGRETVDKAAKLDSLDEGTFAKGRDSDDESARGRRLDDRAWKETPASRPAALPPTPPRMGRGAGAAANPKSPPESDARPELKSAPRAVRPRRTAPAAPAPPQSAAAPQRDASEVAKSNDEYQIRAKMAQEVDRAVREERPEPAVAATPPC